MTPFHNRLYALADDVGRFRRRVEPGSSLEYLADRFADHVSSLHLLVTPSAGEIAGWTFPCDAETVEAAIETVDRAWELLQRRLGRLAA